MREGSRVGSDNARDVERVHADQRVDEIVEDGVLRVAGEITETRGALGVPHEHRRMHRVNGEDRRDGQSGVGQRGVDLGLAPERVALVGPGRGGVGAEEQFLFRIVGGGERDVPGLVASATRASAERGAPRSRGADDPRRELVDRLSVVRHARKQYSLFGSGPEGTMATDFPFDDALRFTAVDDELHQAGPHRDWTETVWFSFAVPERALAGWLYVQTRPNAGSSSGGAFVYDPTGFLAWELPYYGFLWQQPLPEPLDLRAVTFSNGVSVQVVEPTMTYDVGYQFRDQRDFVAELRFTGVSPPVPHLAGAPPFTGSSHYDQHGRVTGELQLFGERIPVDCISVRDRSWGRRPELLGRRTRFSYCFGATSSTDAFLAFCRPATHLDETEELTSGYLIGDGKLRRLVRAERVNVRDPATGGVAHIELHGVDTDGRELHAEADVVSRMALGGSSVGVTINSMLRWTVDGAAGGWGEDQEVWSTSALRDSRARRRER